MIKRLLSLILVLILSISAVFAEENFSYYLKDLRQEIDNKWIPPVYYQRHTSDVEFKIYKDGSIKDVKIETSSKIKQLDTKAVETIKEIDKITALPSSYDSEFIVVTVSMTNYIKQDLKNIYIYKKKNNKLFKDSLPIATKLVKIKKVIYNSNFIGVSNFKEKMIKQELNIDILRAMQKKKY